MQRLKTQKLSDAISEQLELMILDGRFSAGQRLPPERDLATEFAVSRPSIREAIQNLAAKGLVERKQGGGTFVKGRLTSLVSDPLLEMIAQHPETQFDLLEFRHGLEGMAAYYAALRATEQQRSALQQAYAQVIQVQRQQDIEQEAQTLTDFYLLMAKATHNMVLLHVMRGLLPILQDNIAANLRVLQAQPQATEQVNHLREQIVAAINTQDPEQARAASNQLLAYIEQTLLSINQQDSDIQRALRRIAVKQS